MSQSVPTSPYLEPKSPPHQEIETRNENDNTVPKRKNSRSFDLWKEQQKVLQKQMKFPYKQVAILLNDNNDTIKQIMDRTNCKIIIDNSIEHSEHKMVNITLEGTSHQIFNCNQQINYIRQNGHLMIEKSNSLRNRNNPKKLTNWNLDVTDASMLNIVEAISSSSNPTNWAIFTFINSHKNRENGKTLSIDKFGDGGVERLASNVANISELTFCLLRYDYGFDIARHQIILIIWSPSSAHHGQKRNIIPMLRHKPLIKKTLCATVEIPVSIHSYLTPSFILSELHSKHLVSEIILRVTKQGGSSNDDNKKGLKLPQPLSTASSAPSLFKQQKETETISIPKPESIVVQNTAPNVEYAQTDKFLASKDWKLARLTAELSKKYDINQDDIQITHILHSVKKRCSKFNSRKETEHIFDTKCDKTLSELQLFHGSRIYISSISHKRQLSNRYLAAQRRLQFTKTKTMSTVKKIKIQLKLSAHLRSLKSKKKTARFAGCDESLSLGPPSNTRSKTRKKAKSMCYGNVSSPRQRQIETETSLSSLSKVHVSDVLMATHDNDEKQGNNNDNDGDIEMKDTEIECTLDLNEVFIVERSVGRGKTAHVHYAVYRNECDIALKEFRFGRLTEKILYGFHAELETLKGLDHDNICRLLGHYVDEKSNQLYLAFEWVPCGCLYDVLKDESVSIEFEDVLQMCIDIARGMEYLHSQQIMHRDLKSHNLLLDEAYRVKITDFGTAKTLEEMSGTTFTEVGTGGYCAPEVIEPPEIGYDKKVDVFSFGVLMWEIFERKNVFDQRCLRNVSQLEQGVRPQISDYCPKEYKELMSDCWQFDATKRPQFEEIVSRLLSMYSEQNSNSNSN